MAKLSLKQIQNNVKKKKEKIAKLTGLVTIEKEELQKLNALLKEAKLQENELAKSKPATKKKAKAKVKAKK